jgi:RNA polymerase sigma factor (TIGR02999 family)
MSSQAERAPYPEEGQAALDACFERLYENIRHLAHRLGWAANHQTLNTTALAHETYLKLRKTPPEMGSKSQQEIIGIFANAMRQILIDAARRKNAKKRSFELPPESAPYSIEEALAVATALDELRTIEPVQANITEARFILGMTAGETAAALGISVRTVEREWQEARRYLGGKLRPESR